MLTWLGIFIVGGFDYNFNILNRCRAAHTTLESQESVVKAVLFSLRTFIVCTTPHIILTIIQSSCCLWAAFRCTDWLSLLFGSCLIVLFALTFAISFSFSLNLSFYFLSWKLKQLRIFFLVVELLRCVLWPVSTLVRISVSGRHSSVVQDSHCNTSKRSTLCSSMKQ